MANWNIKKKNGQNVMFNDNPRTRTTENKTFNHTQSRGFNQNNFDALSYDEIPDYIIHRHDVIEHRMNPEDLQKMMRMDEESIKEDQKKRTDCYVNMLFSFTSIVHSCVNLKDLRIA